MSEYAKKHCVPCEGGVEPMTVEEAHAAMLEIKHWTLGLDAKSIFKEFAFKNFDETISFVNMVAELAETEGHHPDMHISYDRLKIDLTTHAIGGLSENDFILAAHIDELSL